MTTASAPAVIDLAADQLTDARPRACVGRARHGWVLTVAISDSDTSLSRVWVTITAPSGQAAQLTGTMQEPPPWGYSPLTALTMFGLITPLSNAFDATATVADNDAAWHAVRTLFAALRTAATEEKPDTADDNRTPNGNLNPYGTLSWAAHGFTRRQARDWQAWIDSPLAADQYRRAGYEPKEASDWSGAFGIVPAALAAEFEQAGWAAHELTALTWALFTDTRTAPMDASTLQAWVPMTRPDLAAAAAKAGLGAAEATQAAASGDLDPATLRTLAALRLPAA